MSDTAPSGAQVGVIRLVAGRELRERLRKKSFYVFTGLLVVVILAIGVIGRVADDRGPGDVDVGTTEASAALGPVIDQTAEQLDRQASVTTYGDEEEALSALDEGDVDVVVLPDDGEAVFADEVDDEAFAIVAQAWSSIGVQEALAQAGLTEDEVEQALAAGALEATVLDGSEEDSGIGVLAGTLAAILLFIVLQTFGGYVLVGVVEEKSTAVVEVLLVRARPDQLLAGKVIGIGIAALLQFLLAVAAGLVSLAISGVDVPGEIWSAVPMSLVWFLGGYALYSMLFALAGSLVSRQEDAQAASAPILSLLIGAYMLIFFFGYQPDSTASTVLSLLPPIAPLLMPMRMAAGAASVVEVVVALVLLLLSIWATWKLAGRIYEQVLLQRGSRISWGHALSLLRSGR